MITRTSALASISALSFACSFQAEDAGNGSAQSFEGVTSSKTPSTEGSNSASAEEIASTTPGTTSKKPTSDPMGGTDATAPAPQPIVYDPTPGFYNVADIPDPSLPADGSLDILILGPDSLRPAQVSRALQDSLTASGAFVSVRVDSQTISNEGLISHYFGWTGRDNRLGTLAHDYDYVVLADSEAGRARPETRFVGASEMAALVRSHGATPLLLQATISEGDEEEFWRIAIGTGALPVPAGTTMAQQSSSSWHGYVGALYTAFTEQSISNWSGWTLSSELAGAFVAAYDHDSEASHYEGAFAGLVRVDDYDPVGPYRFMISGTSSERGYMGAMKDLLNREGIEFVATNIGQCGGGRRAVNVECRARAATKLGEGDYLSLFAREYTVSSDSIREAGGSDLLQAQIYDRHWEGNSEGDEKLDQITWAQDYAMQRAEEFGLTWLPHHITFGKYKVITDAPMLNDGTHATGPVNAGLAAMSYVSRTGRSPSVEGLSEEATIAVEAGEHTIRTLATLSHSGTHIPDTSNNRVRIHK